VFFNILCLTWVASEILLAFFMRDENSANSLDKSSLKIIWFTITVAISAGVFLRRFGPVLTDAYFSVIYYSSILLIICGIVIRLYAILKLKKSFTVNVAISEGQKLVKSGLYKYIRHPAYLGSLLSFAGLAIVFNHWFSALAIFIPVLLAFNYRIHIEEKVLRDAFGKEYSTYIKSSWKLLPFIF
jgi:protein-S-isoprenylcysteine O-methyltransferase Ste14